MRVRAKDHNVHENNIHLSLYHLFLLLSRNKSRRDTVFLHFFAFFSLFLRFCIVWSVRRRYGELFVASF